MTEDTEDWENSPDAAYTEGEPPPRVEARVQLLFGDLAEIVTAYHPSDDPLRVPAAALAEQLGVELDALAGVRFIAEVVGEEVREARLTS